MITEDYVSFETAKLLKEKGFDESTSMVYMSYGDLCKCNRYDSICNSNYNDITKNYFECTAPTNQMAIKWLREEKNIIINVWYNGVDFDAEYYNNETENFCLITDSSCNSYKEAVEVALKYALENLI